MLEHLQFVIDCYDGQAVGVELMELVADCGFDALDASVPLGFSRRQYLQRDSKPLASVYELGPELSTTVNLVGASLERRFAEDFFQEALRIDISGATAAANFGTRQA